MVPVDAIDRRALVVPSQHEKILRVFDLVRKEEADALQTLGPTVDIVAQEKVVGLGWEAAILEQTQEVVVLSMDVA